MRKFILTVLTLAGILIKLNIVSAQITINDTHFLQIGSKVYQVTDTLPVNPNIGPAGPNQTWTFTNLNVHTFDSIEAVNPASTPSGALFPTANIALKQQGSTYIYLNNSPTENNLLGVTIPDFNVIFPYSNPEKILVYPTTYLTSFSDTSEGMITVAGQPLGFPVDSVRYKQIRYRTSLIDAYGSLTTDEGTFNNTIRANDTILQIDSIWIKPSAFLPWQFLQEQQTTTFETSWITNDANYGFPLLQITNDGTSIEMKWLTLSPPCSDPSTPASSIGFSSVTSNTANIDWVNGDGGARIVVMRAGAPVAATPVDGQTYTASANYGDPASALGSGYVVYDGTGTNVSVTGLTPGTTYHVAVFEYNCTPKYYNTDAYPNASFNTTGTGIFNAIKNNVALSVFPNPVGLSQVLNLNKSVDFTVYNAIGKVVIMKNNSNVIETSQLSKGVYFIVTSEGEKVKFVVE
ncbi:MAG: T9SS type A sorting domain-containing protein [Bacteroidia bacterium]